MNNRGRLEELLSAMIGQRALLDRLVQYSADDPVWEVQRLAVDDSIKTLEAELAAPPCPSGQ